MGLLRKADLTDFDSFKRIYDDGDNKGYQWLYWDFKPLYEPRDPTEKEKAEFELEFGDILKQLEEEKKRRARYYLRDFDRRYPLYHLLIQVPCIHLFFYFCILLLHHHMQLCKDF